MADSIEPAGQPGHAAEGPLSLAPRVALRIGLVILGLAVATWLVFQLAPVLLLAFVAAILATALVGPVAWLEARGMPAAVAILGIYVAVAVVFIVLLLLLAPPVIGQFVGLAATLPNAASAALDRLQPALAGLGIRPDRAAVNGAIANWLQTATATFAALPLELLGVVGNVLMVVTLSAFIVLERHRARRWISRFFGPDDRAVLLELVDDAALRLGAYVKAQLFIMAVTATGSTIGLMLLGVPFAIALGAFAFLVQMVPLVGPFVWGAAMVAVALLQSPLQALGTLVLVIALQQLEGNVLVPLIQGRLISISPVAALLAVLSGNALGGPVGAIVAIPVVAIASVVIDNIVLPWRSGEIRREAEARRIAEADAKPEHQGDSAASNRRGRKPRPAAT